MIVHNPVPTDCIYKVNVSKKEIEHYSKDSQHLDLHHLGSSWQSQQQQHSQHQQHSESASTSVGQLTRGASVHAR